MSDPKPNTVFSEEAVARLIKVGDTINGNVVTQKVWKRDTPGYYSVFIVQIEGSAEVVTQLNPNVTYGSFPQGLLSTGEIIEKERVQTAFNGSADEWLVTESRTTLQDVLGLKP